jgi:hypothetical protein
VFAGTRVPVETFIEYIQAGESIEEFLEGFPSVQREQLLAFLDETLPPNKPGASFIRKPKKLNATFFSPLPSHPMLNLPPSQF